MIGAQPQLELMDEDVGVNDCAMADVNDRHNLGLSVNDGPDPDAIKTATEDGHKLIELEMGAAKVSEEDVMQPQRV
jgi:hypothetical protein